MRLGGVLCRHRLATQDVLAVRDVVEVCWIHAATNATAVIKVLVVRLAEGRDERDAMRVLESTKPEMAVADVGRGTDPDPAARHRARLHLRPEALRQPGITEVHLDHTTLAL
jgi:hypothetical protein